MSSSSRPELRVEADLRVDIDGVHAQVVGHGDELRVVTDRPSDLWRAAARTAPTGGRRAGLAVARRAGGVLAAHGLTVVVPAPSGGTLRLGATARPGVVGRLAGLPHVEIDLGPRARRVSATVASVAGVALAFAALRRLRG